MKTLQHILISKIGFTKNETNEFVNSFIEKKFKKREFIVKEGQICNHLGFVETGVIKSFMQKDDVEYNNAFYLPNHFFSAYSSFTKQKPAVSFLQAMAETKVHLISFEQLNNLYESNSIWYKFGKFIAEQFFYKKCERETSLLQDSAFERYQKLTEKYPTIEQLLPQYEIASYLNIKPESLSRLKALTYINK